MMINLRNICKSRINKHLNHNKTIYLQSRIIKFLLNISEFSIKTKKNWLDATEHGSQSKSHLRPFSIGSLLLAGGKILHFFFNLIGKLIFTEFYACKLKRAHEFFFFCFFIREQKYSEWKKG